MRRAFVVPAFWAAIVLAGATAPIADASPPGFPDLDAFSAVDPAPYVEHGLKASRVGFTTPTMTCSWDYLQDHNAHVVAGCRGTIVGMPAEARQSEIGSSCDGVGSTFTRGSGPCPPPDEYPRLAPGHKLTAVNTTCAVTDDGVACIDPIVNHGFVVQPSGSWVF
ncbi:MULTISPECIES: hypothetical protein [unclassified Mycolicibacterium]|uniref:hypothetical protein n=1 Tax=unclassified Mycolicibacterium TaxID=2636767 RepID=UPI0012DC3997|nr:MULTISPECIES: hypothetical protein [unclassified Mycolicibacterium]MUL81542.1 hypothetical protein [Mycolicibacterium sp. CBMA 329]MUL87308.1 hypothetical protein [Mycolicibacterium sp. CBMA 331]MUM02595.1 hypothetical protein [Mycolicibacterium sp. CBMA 334]MUM25170.1 hypothetical protein [Mycolicibacterium sp. CBMA 295]MUM37605.1 hypothetical protein [Mycolicibacterium sp. CBMA 247]